MKKLRFKNRNGILYYGFGDKFKSSKLKYNTINRNIIVNKFKNGMLDGELGLVSTKQNLSLVTELLKEVMDGKRNVLKHKTMLAYSVTCRNSIIPYFKGRLVSEIKPIDIKNFQDKLVDKGLKKQSINLARVLLKEVFALGIINEEIELNPIKMVDMPKFRSEGKKHKQKPFTLDEIDFILSNTHSDLRNFLGIAFFTGMRSGEILALEWKDIDFSTDTISINKTIAEGYINSPKTASSYRDIEMIDKAKEFFKAQQLETGIRNSFVFLNRKETHYGSNTHFYCRFQSILEKLEIEKRSLHNTRHTFASLMINNHIDMMWVSNTLGHENLDMTLKIYTHFMPRKKKMSIDFLEKRYKNGTERI